MEGLLGSVDLWKYVQNGFVDSHDKRRGALALYLIHSALDESTLSYILYEFGEVHNAKMFWDILEMEFGVKSRYMDESQPNKPAKAEVGDPHYVECNPLVVAVQFEIEIENGPRYDEEILTELEKIAIKNEMKFILEMMNGEEGSLSAECNGDVNAINIVETLNSKIAVESNHVDAVSEEGDIIHVLTLLTH